MTEKLGAGSPFNTPGYDKLANVLVAAYDQSAHGKGKERHANDLPFDKQPIMDIARMLPGIGGHAYQIMKKAQEASGMVARGELEKAQAELLGVIVYAAAAHVRLDELEKAQAELLGAASKFDALADGFRVAPIAPSGRAATE